MKQLAPLEADIMQTITDLNRPVTVGDVKEAYTRKLAYTTIKTVLDRLYDKGHLIRKKVGPRNKQSYALNLQLLEQYDGLIALRTWGPNWKNRLQKAINYSNLLECKTEDLSI